jgi:hypothetical protein
MVLTCFNFSFCAFNFYYSGIQDVVGAVDDPELIVSEVHM